MFYVFRPLYNFSGERFESLRASAHLLNLACLAFVLAAVRRRAGPALTVCLTVAFAVFILRSPDVLDSPWNPHLLLMPLAVLFVACAALLEGNARYAPVVVAAASFLVQTHLSVTPTAGAVTLAAVAWILVAGRTRLRQPDHWGWIHVSVWVGVVMWFLPLAQEVASPKGNLSAIVESFFEAPQPGPGSRESAAAFFRMLSGYLLPQFETAWGGLKLETVSTAGFAIAAGCLLALPWAGRRLGVQSPFSAMLAALLFGSSIVALWSVLRIQGDLFDQLIFWLSIIGILNTALVAAACLTWAVENRPTLAKQVSQAARVAPALLLGLVVVVGVSRANDPARNHPDDPTSVRIRAGAEAVSSFLAREGAKRPVVRIAPITWGDAAGIVLILEKGGTEVTIERDWLFMFGQPMAETGAEDAEVVLADGGRKKALLAEGTHTVLAEWPELTIFARTRRAPPST
jgi:hypothetical protein